MLEKLTRVRPSRASRPGGVAAAWRRRRRTWRCAACSSAAVNRESSLDIDTTRLVGQGQARLAVECRAL
ncbi:Uncharacterised protein [Bordetella pertussis]|nr:Uncharacterised protein [Bordetella pertussis]